MTDFTISEGDVVRLDKVPHRVIRLHLTDHTVTLIGPRGLRTVDSFRLTPAHKGDVVQSNSQPPAKRSGRR